MIFETSRKVPGHLQAVEQVKAWTRERFGLPQEAAILVAELACALPGCPPLETVVVFWTTEETRYRFKLFKSVTQVANDDLPYAWLMSSLIDNGDPGADCC
jgi:hypothetical protein